MKLTEKEKSLLVAEVVKILAEVMFEHHLYIFGGKVYRQRKGGPFGLRGTCALARLRMCNLDRLWKRLMMENRVTINGYMRYMDDVRSFLCPFKKVWRWVEDGLRYKEAWRIEDKDKTDLEITENILGKSMQVIHASLKFTL